MKKLLIISVLLSSCASEKKAIRREKIAVGAVFTIYAIGGKIIADKQKVIK